MAIRNSCSGSGTSANHPLAGQRALLNIDVMRPLIAVEDIFWFLQFKNDPDGITSAPILPLDRRIDLARSTGPIVGGFTVDGVCLLDWRTLWSDSVEGTTC